MYAITTFGIGKPVTARSIMPEWELVEGESLKVDNWQEGMIWDGETVRMPTEQELEETPEQIVARLESAIDQHLDFVARSYRYETIRTMVTYATSEHPTFGAEGRAAVKFRDACYQHGIDVISDVQAGTREVPTEAELIAEMPTFESFLGT